MDYRELLFKRYYLQKVNDGYRPMVRYVTGHGIQCRRTNRKRKWLEKHGSI